MERALTDWERSVIAVLASVDRDGGDVVRDSLPHLVVTGECGCGCASFNVRDDRYPPQPHRLEHFSNGVTDMPNVGLVLWIGPEGRPIAVDIEHEAGVLPDPSTIVASIPPSH